MGSATQLEAEADAGIADRLAEMGAHCLGKPGLPLAGE